jgi:class 3 adenylate cyclase
MSTEAIEQPAAPAQSITRLAVLLFTDLVGSTELKSKLGGSEYARRLGRHNALFEETLHEASGGEVIKHTGDGYFAVFPTASDVVRFALVFQSRIGLEPWGPRPLRTRLGIHIGEVALVDMAGRKDVVGLSADVAARLMSLAVGGASLTKPSRSIVTCWSVAAGCSATTTRTR